MNTKPVDFEKHARDWSEAWNAHDLDRILEHYSEDVELISPFVVALAGQKDGTLRGKPAVREYFARGLAAYPDLRFEVLRLYPGVRSCVLEYRSVNGLIAAEAMEFDAQDRITRVLAHYVPAESLRS